MAPADSNRDDTGRRRDNDGFEYPHDSDGLEHRRHRGGLEHQRDTDGDKHQRDTDGDKHQRDADGHEHQYDTDGVENRIDRDGFQHGHDRDSLERRLEAVERALADDEPLERRDRLDDLEDRVVELEAAVQALRGYVGSVRAVNEDVERRADRALRKASAIERHVAPDAVRFREGDPEDPVDPPGSRNPDGDSFTDSSRDSDVEEDSLLARFRWLS